MSTQIYDRVRFDLEVANDKAHTGMSDLRYAPYVNEGGPLELTKPPKQITAQELEELKELVARLKDAESNLGPNGDRGA